MKLRIIHHQNTVFTSLSYVIFDDRQRFCWIVDVGDCDEICKMIEGYELKGILLTHVHYDHIYGLNDLQQLYPQVPIYTNQFGVKSLQSPTDNLSVYHDDCFVLNEDAKVIVLKEGERIEFGLYQAVVMETPGHDHSCLSFLIDDICFTGDAYIPGVKVFTKLQNGDSAVAKVSRSRLKGLEGVAIYPGHLVSLNDK